MKSAYTSRGGAMLGSANSSAASLLHSSAMSPKKASAVARPWRGGCARRAEPTYAEVASTSARSQSQSCLRPLTAKNADRPNGRRRLVCATNPGSNRPRESVALGAGHHFSLGHRGAVLMSMSMALVSCPQATCPTAALNLCGRALLPGIGGVMAHRSGTQQLLRSPMSGWPARRGRTHRRQGRPPRSGEHRRLRRWR
jgi:hypothetical protein